MRILCCLVYSLIATGSAFAEEPGKFKHSKPDEPLAKNLSLEKAATYLDASAQHWLEQHNCGSCHSTYPYMMARSALKDSTTHKEVRAFLEKRIAHWDEEKKEDKPRWDAEVVTTAAALAVNDAQTTGKLHPLTRQALDRMWSLQKAEGTWNWLLLQQPPFEHDEYYGALLAAVGVGHAPDNYAQSEKAKLGLARLREYFKKNPPPNMHHQAWLLWASLKLDGLMSAEERKKAIGELLKLQRADGGWGLATMGEWKGQKGPVDGTKEPSDGYGTGLVVYILRQAGVPASDKAIMRGVDWLKTHQRESGRWFTKTLNGDDHHYMTDAGTAYAMLALKACE
jgi:squalene-hopene/tetraprenyl-beta-curcumene cyclase